MKLRNDLGYTLFRIDASQTSHLYKSNLEIIKRKCGKIITMYRAANTDAHLQILSNCTFDIPVRFKSGRPTFGSSQIRSFR